MKKKHTIPLLRDNHTHLSFYSILSDCFDISSIDDKKDLYGIIRSLPDDSVSVILGWNSSFYEFNVEDEKSFPPVIIVDISLHGIFISDSAKVIIPENYHLVVQNYKDPEWCEKNLFQIMRFITCFYDINDNKLDKYFNYLLKQGIYYAEDLLVCNEAFIDSVENTRYDKRTSFWTDINVFESFSKKNRDKIKGIKVFSDGANGARTASVSSGYLDGKKGNLLYSDQELYKYLLKTHKTKKPVSVHAIGDIALNQLLDIIGSLKNKSVVFPELRIEHCQFIDKKAAIEAKKAGLILSMQPNFSIETITYTDRLSEDYLKGNNPFRMLIDEAGFEPGIDLIFGSDGMPHGVFTALNAAFFPPLENQKLTLEEFVAGYCIDTYDKGVIEFSIDFDQKKIIDLKINPQVNI